LEQNRDIAVSFPLEQPEQPHEESRHRDRARHDRHDAFGHARGAFPRTGQGLHQRRAGRRCHYAGNHGVLGAAAGCIIGRHQAKRQQQANPNATR
jgi:hypothetical protein